MKVESLMFIELFSLHTLKSYASSIPSSWYVAPRSDGILIDVSVHIDIRGEAGLSHRTVTDNEISPPTGDVVDINTVGNVRVNIGQIKGRGRDPSKFGRDSLNRSQVS